MCYSTKTVFEIPYKDGTEKEGREKENEVAKIVIKSHTFLFHPHKVWQVQQKSKWI